MFEIPGSNLTDTLTPPAGSRNVSCHPPPTCDQRQPCGGKPRLTRTLPCFVFPTFISFFKAFELFLPPVTHCHATLTDT